MNPVDFEMARIFSQISERAKANSQGIVYIAPSIYVGTQIVFTRWWARYFGFEPVPNKLNYWQVKD